MGNHLRFFLRLICDFDLTRYRALNMQRLVEIYDLSRWDIVKAMATLVNIGILEIGPQGRLMNVRGRLTTYRIRPAYLLSPNDLREHFRETREREERESLLPIRDWREIAPTV